MSGWILKAGQRYANYNFNPSGLKSALPLHTLSWQRIFSDALRHGGDLLAPIAEVPKSALARANIYFNVGSDSGQTLRAAVPVPSQDDT